MTESELYEKQLERYAKRTYPIFIRALVEQVQPTLEFIRRTENTDPPLDILVDPNIWIRPMQQAYELVATTAARREYYWMRNIENKAILDFLIDAWRAVFMDYSTNYAYRIMNELSETTREEIRRALKESYDQNLNANQTATYIRKRVGREIPRSRAVLIARTESATAANLGKLTGAKSWLEESGQEGYKQWIGRVVNERSTHLALNDTIIPMDEDFMVGGEKATAPGDTRLSADERCNCRCTVIYMSKRRYDRMQAAKGFVLEDLI